MLLSLFQISTVTISGIVCISAMIALAVQD